MKTMQVQAAELDARRLSLDNSYKAPTNIKLAKEALGRFNLDDTDSDESDGCSVSTPASGKTDKTRYQMSLEKQSDRRRARALNGMRDRPIAKQDSQQIVDCEKEDETEETPGNRPLGSIDNSGGNPESAESPDSPSLDDLVEWDENGAYSGVG